MLLRRAAVVALLVGACGHHSGGQQDADVDTVWVPDACEGLACFQFDCAAKGAPPTTVSGTVYAPNGTLPLYGVDVYVPKTDPGPLPDGVQCDRCDKGLLGGAYTQARTDEAGHFVLENVPATSSVPLVIQTGKWRRQIVLPNVAPCEELALPMTDTRLPKDRTEGDIPKIAFSTGSADALECLPLKLGISPTEITTPGNGGRIQLYTNAVSGGQGASTFQANWPGGTGGFGNSQTLWSNVDNLKPYDLVFLSCEGGQFPATKPQSSMQALHDYADLGGRVFMTHWHNIWIGGENGNLTHGLADWQAVATWNYGAPQSEATQLDVVDETVPKGMSFATWLLNVNASTVRGEIPISEPRYTCSAHDATKSERWVYVDPARSTPAGKVSVQDLMFTTPQNKLPEERCGKVVFSDMHVSSGSTSAPGTAYPGGCNTGPLTPQEKALAFMFFDIASCVGSIF